MRGEHAILYGRIADPRRFTKAQLAQSWRTPRSMQELKFNLSYGFAGTANVTDDEVKAFEAHYSSLDKEFRKLVNRYPVLGSSPEVEPEALSPIDQKREAILDTLFQSGDPTGVTFCILISPNGTASAGRWYFPFPEHFFLSICNTQNQQEFYDLNEEVWSWLDPLEAQRLASVEWIPSGIIRPRRLDDPEWNPYTNWDIEQGPSWYKTWDPIKEAWSWFGDWDTFQSEQRKLRSLVTAFQKGEWSEDHSDALTVEVADKTSVVPMDQAPWLTMDWPVEDFEAKNRWTGQENAGPEHDYTVRPINARLIHGIWGLPYIELGNAIRHASRPALCPDCGLFLPQVPRRHSDRRCDECRSSLKRNRDRERSKRYRATKQNPETKRPETTLHQ